MQSRSDYINTQTIDIPYYYREGSYVLIITNIDTKESTSINLIKKSRKEGRGGKRHD